MSITDLRLVQLGKQIAGASFVNDRLSAIAQQWREERNGPGRWQLIREAYRWRLPAILCGQRCDPYFLDWDFTPIERLAWHDIRSQGLPLYPQFPALQYFIDFADPVRQVGVELDGREFHCRERDVRRDHALKLAGWKIFHVAGRESLPSPDVPFQQSEWPALSSGEQVDRLVDWGRRWSDGFFWALGVGYFGKSSALPRREALIAAEEILVAHQFVEFPLRLEDQG